jgi:hypothetical protein
LETIVNCADDDKPDVCGICRDGIDVDSKIFLSLLYGEILLRAMLEGSVLSSDQIQILLSTRKPLLFNHIARIDEKLPHRA